MGIDFDQPFVGLVGPKVPTGEYSISLVGVPPLLITCGLNIQEVTLPVLSFVGSFVSSVTVTNARCTAVKDSRLMLLASNCARHTQ